MVQYYCTMWTRLPVFEPVLLHGITTELLLLFTVLLLMNTMCISGPPSTRAIRPASLLAPETARALIDARTSRSYSLKSVPSKRRVIV